MPYNMSINGELILLFSPDEQKRLRVQDPWMSVGRIRDYVNIVWSFLVRQFNTITDNVGVYLRYSIHTYIELVFIFLIRSADVTIRK